jgi:hypothetical protein
MRREEKVGRIRLTDKMGTGKKNIWHVDPNQFREIKREESQEPRA